ncbi:hypothetical protein SDC9_140564 [bioreactor metagenome]|uniref:Uncharacterized protein n=1 Tax=bioreactor metagenome TaxID=1076179 RepID=A0A645DVM6_9ZZZZ
MWISHRNTSDFIWTLTNKHASVDNRSTIQTDRYFFRIQYCFAHVDLDFFGDTVFNEKFYRFDSTQCFNGHYFFLNDAVVVQIFGNASDCIATHLAFTAVNIEHSHFCIGNFRRINCNDTVTANTKVPVG